MLLRQYSSGSETHLSVIVMSWLI